MNKGGLCYETYQNIEHQGFKKIHEKRWMWRMPDILPVCLQNIMHCRQSELRKSKIMNEVI